VPICNGDGQVVATMSTALPAASATDVRMHQLTTLLLEQAGAASARIRASGSVFRSPTVPIALD
jgi:DNA-binding IclR family transcriptional regulator